LFNILLRWKEMRWDVRHVDSEDSLAFHLINLLGLSSAVSVWIV